MDENSVEINRWFNDTTAIFFPHVKFPKGKCIDKYIRIENSALKSTTSDVPALISMCKTFGGCMCVTVRYDILFEKLLQK